jgi:transposase
VVIFDILKRGGRVHTALPPDLKRATLMPTIREKVRPDSVVFTDGFASYDRLDPTGFTGAGFTHVWIDQARSLLIVETLT